MVSGRICGIPLRLAAGWGGAGAGSAGSNAGRSRRKCTGVTTTSRAIHACAGRLSATGPRIQLRGGRSLRAASPAAGRRGRAAVPARRWGRGKALHAAGSTPRAPPPTRPLPRTAAGPRHGCPHVLARDDRAKSRPRTATGPRHRCPRGLEKERGERRGAACRGAPASPSLSFSPSAPPPPAFRGEARRYAPPAQFAPQGRPRLPAGCGEARRYTSSESRRADTSVVGRPCFSIRCSAGGFSS